MARIDEVAPSPALLSHQHTVLVQGITGREAAMVVGHALAYGTAVVAGVTPGRGGQAVQGVPVYDTVAQAVAARGPTATVISVPPAGALDAVLEALAAGLRLLVVVTERVPQHDALKLAAAARAAGATLIGPNCTGVLAPARRLKLGPIGGDRPERCFAPGRVAIVSRSGGMTAECAWMTRRAGEGVSLALSLGGDPIIGTRPAEALARLETDPATAAAVLWGEPGTTFEEEVADLLLAGGFTKPLIAHVAGRFVEEQPAGTVFGHAAALAREDRGRPAAKAARLRAAGARVIERLDELGEQLRQALERERESGFDQAEEAAAGGTASARRWRWREEGGGVGCLRRGWRAELPVPAHDMAIELIAQVAGLSLERAHAHPEPHQAPEQAGEEADLHQ